jgi:small subunit ribosomal protein S1
VEFSKDDRRIVLSHTAVYNQQQEEDSRAAKFKKKGPAGQAPTATQGEGKLTDLKKQPTAEKSTLGDLDALSALRDKMMGTERQVGEQKLSAKAAPAAEATPATEIVLTDAEAPAAEGGILAAVTSAVTGAATAAFDKVTEVAGDVVDTVKNALTSDDTEKKEDEQA